MAKQSARDLINLNTLKAWSPLILENAHQTGVSKLVEGVDLNSNSNSIQLAYNDKRIGSRLSTTARMMANTLNEYNSASGRDYDARSIMEEWKKESEAHSNGRLYEDVTQTGNVARFDRPLAGMIRRGAVTLMAHDIVGVQPLMMPTSQAFFMVPKYKNKAGADALFNEADTAYSGTGTHVSSDPFDPTFATGTAFDTDVGETTAWAEMSVTIGSAMITAKTRNIRSSITREIITDMRTVHGLDANYELANICSQEMTAEIDRELIRAMVWSAKPGAQNATTPGKFDMATDASGTWKVEKTKSLLTQILRDAAVIGQEIRRPMGGNFVIVTPGIAAEFAGAMLFDVASNLKDNMSINTNNGEMGFGYIGTIANGIKVYVDPYAKVDVEYYVVGYKGASALDNGICYCPYTLMEYIDGVTDFNNLGVTALGFKSRYGIVSNPLFTPKGIAPGTIQKDLNSYYRKVQVVNL